MDPDATLADLVWTLEQMKNSPDFDYDELFEHSNNLLEWMGRKGFMPTVSQRTFTALLEFIRQIAKERSPN